jgi:hypothetical protein
MKFKIEIPQQQITDLVVKYNENLNRAIVRKLSIIGEECITLARNLGEEYRSMSVAKREFLRHRPHQPNYIDLTGNLRHSLSYVVLKDGEEVKSDYGTNKQPSAQIAAEMKSKYPNGYTLILIAGMEYAAELTFLKGYDVLSSPNIKAKELFSDFINELKAKAK